ncbi:MAG: hypothetical protein AAFY39_10440 [Pseudomonadota bacterium]
MAQVDFSLNTRKARVLERRAARARRSKWLGRMIFSLLGMGMLIGLRMHPDIVEDIVRLAHDVPPRTQHATLSAPTEVEVRHMPGDRVPVRRAGSVATD